MTGTNPTPHADVSDSVFQRVEEAAHFIHQQTHVVPKIGVILGSGLGAFAQILSKKVAIPFAEIPHFSVPKVAGHAGELVLGYAGEMPCAILSGRVHHYEGHSLDEVTFAVRVLQAIGVERLLVTNSAGGLDAAFEPGDMMIITDHINLTGHNPLRGEHDARLGVRFLDMSQAYAAKGQQAWQKAASRLNLRLCEGVYAGVSGPCYETPAEVRMLQAIGGSAVGMSTVHEVIVARHCGLTVAGLSVITNRAAGLSKTLLSHQEVTDIAAQVRPKLVQLLLHMVQTWI